MHRRDFLRTSAAFTALGLGGSSARASAHDATMKFIFVFAQGGWDATRVFADGFDIPGVSMEAGASRAEIGGISFIDHPSRPSVAQFFSQYYENTLIINGLLVPSIAHEICTMLAMTGTSQGTAPDWASILGEHQRDLYTLPSLVVGALRFLARMSRLSRGREFNNNSITSSLVKRSPEETSLYFRCGHRASALSTDICYAAPMQRRSMHVPYTHNASRMDTTRLWKSSQT